MGIGLRVKGEGPIPAPFIFIGEWPGKEEAKCGRPFAHRSKLGREMDRFLDGVRLPNRDEAYLTTWIKEWCGEDGDYDQSDFDRDEPELETEIRAVRPSVIITLGRHITRWFLGDVDMESTHAIPWRAGVCQCGKPIQLTGYFGVSSTDRMVVGCPPVNQMQTGIVASGLTDSLNSPTLSPTSASSDSSTQKPLTIFVETSDASTLHIWNQKVPETTPELTSPTRLTVGEAISSPEQMCTLLREHDVISASVEFANVKLVRVGRGCTCAAGSEWREVVVVPLYSPSAGFRSPEISATVAYDFAQLESVLDHSVTPRILYDDPIPHPDYHEIVDQAELDEVMLHATQISTDTEGYAWAVWSAQITVRDGESFIIRAALCGKPNPILARFAEWVNTCRDQYIFIFHNALHDLAVFRAVGIDTTELKFHDTMIMSYNLQLEPQGLKPLCARWCNMKMMHFDECMGDASYRLAQDWLMMALENEDFDHATRCHAEFSRLTTTPYVDGRGKLQSGRRLKVDPKLPKTDLHKSIERCLRSKDPRKLWGDQVIDRHVDAAPRYGAMWEATLDHVPLERAIGYAGRDSDGTGRLFPVLEERIRANDLWDVYQADLGTVPLIDRMQQTGIRPNLPHFVLLSEDLAFELVEIRTRLASQLVLAGVPHEESWNFNANSSDHVGALLFERFNIPSLKRTPGGDPSTNDKVLEALEKDQRLAAEVRNLVGDIREYREVYKLKSTFVDQIPNFTNRWPWDGRIHPTFRLTRVVTGRLAASNPNILAMPKHGKFAKRFRAGFVSRDGAVLASWDLSQIELRVLAHLSQDPVLLNAFRTGVDLHATLAQRIFGVAPKDQDESKHRLPAKAVNFGIPMGMTNIGLCLELRKNGVDLDEDDAQRWLTETMALYKDVPHYQQGKIAEAKRYGYVTDIRGRRRYIGGIRSFDDATRSEAERFAFSTPIQAGAQEVMKEAEKYVYYEILVPDWKAGRYNEPLIQIHDDLVLESELLRDGRILPHPTKPNKKIIEFKDCTLHEEMVYAMTKIPAHWLSVPIETEGTAGYNWGEMYPIRHAA